MKNFFKSVFDFSKEVLNSAGSYDEKAVIVYEKVLKSLTEKGFPKENIQALCDVEDISRVFSGVDELAEAGYKIDKESVALFKLCEDICKKEVMNTNNKSEREEWIYETVYTLIKKIVKSPVRLYMVEGVEEVYEAMIKILCKNGLSKAMINKSPNLPAILGRMK